MLNTGKIIQATIALAICVLTANSLNSQAQLPELLQTGELREQLDFIEERTRIYDNFRAIREDMFQKVKSNSLDTVAGLKRRIGELDYEIVVQQSAMDSLALLLEDTRNKLDIAVQNRDNMELLGLSMNKTGYNLIMWSVIAGLSFLLVTGFLLLKRSRVVMNRALSETEELKAEFEEFRKTSRETREKLVIEHFNEVKKLRGKSGI